MSDDTDPISTSEARVISTSEARRNPPADDGDLSSPRNARRDDSAQLIPAIVRDVKTREVLMLAYMNDESLAKTRETGETWFWSRSRQELWHKGATSGNRQLVKAIAEDCDGDALLIDVEPLGPACHTGAVSCFDRVPHASSRPFGTQAGEDARATRETLETLMSTLAQRKRDMPEGSYTAYLFASGVDKILKKVGEEASEVIIAAKGDSRERVVSEVSDLIYHLCVLLVEQGVELSDVMAELEKRATTVQK